MKKKTDKTKKSIVKESKKKNSKDNYKRISKTSAIEIKKKKIDENTQKKYVKIAKTLFSIFLLFSILLLIISIFLSRLYLYNYKKCSVCDVYCPSYYSSIEHKCNGEYERVSKIKSSLPCVTFYYFFAPPDCPDVFKPIIYLYPENKTEIAVQLGNPQKISHSYPKYENKWVVTAKPNGDLTYNNRYYYGLYWEGKNAPKIKLDEGFVVKGSDSITFLEEKLAILGLNEREANEFIIYWLPKLENNPYNFIKFASMEVQNKYMPLNIEPKPDTLIRVMMAYKGLDNPIKIKEQILEPSPKRNGFVVIEWGGTEINSDKVY